ncbi:hypothetical protein ACXHQT_17150, partial [Vibrio cincinnatiensis]
RLTRGCNPTSSKFIHTWLRFGEIMRGSLSAARWLSLLKRLLCLRDTKIIVVNIPNNLKITIIIYNVAIKYRINIIFGIVR